MIEAPRSRWLFVALGAASLALTTCGDATAQSTDTYDSQLTREDQKIIETLVKKASIRRPSEISEIFGINIPISDEQSAANGIKNYVTHGYRWHIEYHTNTSTSQYKTIAQLSVNMPEGFCFTQEKLFRLFQGESDISHGMHARYFNLYENSVEPGERLRFSSLFRADGKSCLPYLDVYQERTDG